MDVRYRREIVVDPASTAFEAALTVFQAALTVIQAALRVFQANDASDSGARVRDVPADTTSPRSQQGRWSPAQAGDWAPIDARLPGHRSRVVFREFRRSPEVVTRFTEASRLRSAP